MKSTIEIYLHGENKREVKLVEISAESTIAEIADKYKKEFATALESGEEIEVFLQDEDEPKNKNDNGNKLKIKKRMHCHCHRCKKITSKIEYNGQYKELNLAPSSTGEKVLRKAAKEFSISQKDTADLFLKLPDGNIFEITDHIGSFVSFPNCQINLILTHNTQIQG